MSNIFMCYSKLSFLIKLNFCGFIIIKLRQGKFVFVFGKLKDDILSKNIKLVFTSLKTHLNFIIFYIYVNKRLKIIDKKKGNNKILLQSSIHTHRKR